VVFCSYGVGFPRRNSSGSKMATRGCLRADIMQFSPLELLLGSTTPSVVAGMLRFTVAEVGEGEDLL